jgi:hypothetical protein
LVIAFPITQKTCAILAAQSRNYTYNWNTSRLWAGNEHNDVSNHQKKGSEKKAFRARAVL